MLRSIVAASLKFRYLVVAIAAVMMVFGIVQISDNPVDVFPEFAPPRVEIQTPCLGLTAGGRIPRHCSSGAGLQWHGQPGYHAFQVTAGLVVH
jgi:hypothetical protein